MDVSTILERLRSNYYRRLEAVTFDANLIQKNCETYNRRESDICEAAVRLTRNIMKAVSAFSRIAPRDGESGHSGTASTTSARKTTRRSHAVAVSEEDVADEDSEEGDSEEGDSGEEDSGKCDSKESDSEESDSEESDSEESDSVEGDDDDDDDDYTIGNVGAPSRRGRNRGQGATEKRAAFSAARRPKRGRSPPALPVTGSASRSSKRSRRSRA